MVAEDFTIPTADEYYYLEKTGKIRRLRPKDPVHSSQPMPAIAAAACHLSDIEKDLPTTEWPAKMRRGARTKKAAL